MSGYKRAGLKFGDSHLMHGAVSFDAVGPPVTRTTLVHHFRIEGRDAHLPLTFGFPSYTTRILYTNTHSRFTHSKWLHKSPHTVAQHTSNKTTSSTTSKTFSRATAFEFLQHLVVVFGPSAAETTANHGRHTTKMSSSIENPQAAAQSTSPEQGLNSLCTAHDTCSRVIACDRYNPAVYA
jgi:hypothetical protein